MDVQKLRRTKGLSIGEAAHCANMSAVDFIRMERGESGATPKNLQRVYEILKNVPDRNNQ
jgi:predicted transcriptional regulator